MDTTNPTPSTPEQTAAALGKLTHDQLRAMAVGLKVKNASTMGKPDLITAVGRRLREIADVPEPAEKSVGKRSPRGAVLTPAGIGTTRSPGKRQPGRKFGPPTKLARALNEVD